MHKHNVIIEQVNIHDKEEELNQESNEKSYETAVVCGLVIVVNFKQVTIQFLVTHVYNDYKDKIQAHTKTVPSN